MEVRVAREKMFEGMVFTPGPQTGVAPEDLLSGAGNPDVYLDKLPQPYRFINKCLEGLVLGRVWERIKDIEEQKRLGKYENDVPKAVRYFSADPCISPEKDLLFHRIAESRFLLVGFHNKMQQINIDSRDNLDPFTSTLQIFDLQQGRVLDEVRIPGEVKELGSA